jgi:hypothetical protein
MWQNDDSLRAQIDALLQNTSLVCERKGKDSVKTIDLRPAIYDLRIEGDRLLMILGLGEGGYAKATEVAGFLAEGRLREPSALPFHRRDMYRVDESGVRTPAMEL